MTNFGELVERAKQAADLLDSYDCPNRAGDVRAAATAIEQQAATIAELRDLLSQTKGALNGSRTRLEAAEADARRYRWLKENHLQLGPDCWIRTGEDLDDATDAAIAKGAP